jgi:hypothetical protein
MRKNLLCCLFCLFTLSSANAQKTAVDYGLYFKTVTVVPEPNALEYLTAYSVVREHSFNSQFFKIVQFYEIPGQQEKDILKNAGVELLDYLPDRAYFAALKNDLVASAIKNMGIRSIVDVETDYKLAPMLYEENYPGHALLEDGRIRLLVSYYPNLDPTQVVESLIAEGLLVTDRDDFGKFVYVVAPVSEIRIIAALPFVVFVEPVSPEPEPENYTGRTLHHTNVIASDYVTGRHYDGTGVHVMLQDDGVIGPHIDYQGRIGAQFLTNNNGNHGDHCAGIIMGAGNVDPKAKGNAFGADLYVYSVSPNYPGFTAIPTVYNTLGIRVTSASYSDGCNLGYTALARTLDQQVRTYPSLFHVFSAGNAGTDNCGYGAGAGWGNITGGHKMGKNVITVANLDYHDNLSSSSSRGPAHDGRIKPDIGAKGTDVYSTIDPNTYALKSGTSMSCPGVAGTLAQLFQAYHDLNNGNDPRAGLLKAIILNTAEDLGNAGPDFKFGWGRINAMRAVQVIEENRFDSGIMTQGATATHIIAVPANTAQLRVMVYWTDYEASVNTNWALVNNLDITLTDPASTVWKPWVLSHYPLPDSLNKPAVRGVDNRNNMEQVTLENPDAGTYTLHVQGVNIPQGPQTYYVVYEFIPDAVILTYPIGGEALVPGEAETIRWDAFGSSEPFSIGLSLDNGQNWESIAENLPGNTRYYYWTIPATLTGQALVKVTKGGSVSQSVGPFSIIGVPCNVKVDWACDEALHLSWSEVIGAASYEVLKLGEKYMESVGTTSGTSFIVEDTSTITSTWLSVRAIGANGAKGRRTIAIEKAPGIFNCYLADAMMVSAPNAEWGVFQSCMDLNQVNIPVVVRNFGLEPITNPILHFQLDKGTVYSGTYNGTIEPDSIANYTFAEKIDISEIGSYILKTWVDYPPDPNPGNDTLQIPIEVIEGSTISIGNVQTFDNWLKCSSAPICEAYSCALEEGWFNLANEIYDQHDWRTFKGSTPTTETGPESDHTTGTASGIYLYIEPSTLCLNKLASVSMPCIDLTNGINPELTLWYHAYGADIGSFHIDLFAGSDVIMDVTSPIRGNQGNEWKKLEIDLTPWVGQVVGIRFRGITSCNQKGDFAIDDFSVTEVIASVEDVQPGLSDKLSVYPNPANREIMVLANNAGIQNYTLHIIDMFGRVVYNKVISTIDNKIHEVIDVSNLVNGTYLLELRSDEKAYQKKLSIR